jgi:hypothetical protein
MSGSGKRKRGEEKGKAQKSGDKSFFFRLSAAQSNK